MGRIGLGLVALLVLTGCAMAPAQPDRREALARQIADDAVAFNEAYGRAVSSQILLNIMRGRDRLPRYYLAMTGIADSPSLRTSQSAGIGSAPLGEGGSPWGFGNVGVERETASRPAYAVQPFDAQTLTRTAFEPTHTEVFAHYWRSGWPRDILLLLMVERIEKVDANGQRQTFVNEANTIAYDCVERVESSGCEFVREIRDFLGNFQGELPEDGVDALYGEPICGLVQSLGPTTPVRAAPAPTGRACDPVFVIASTRVTLHLRSLDDVIYYVGELLRAGSMTSGEAAIEAQVNVGAAGLRGGGAGVPLFRVIPADEARAQNGYAAAIDYGGTRYVAGPAIGRSCYDAADDGPCRDDAEHGDRSSSVLSLIAELMALNQSPDSIRAPNRLIAE